MFEVSRVLIVKEVLNDAAYKGCEIGASPLSDNAAITAAIKSILSDNHVNPDAATIAVQVNDQVKDVKLAKENDKITVVVSIPFSSVSWTKAHKFIPGLTICAEMVVMLKQG